MKKFLYLIVIMMFVATNAFSYRPGSSYNEGESGGGSTGGGYSAGDTMLAGDGTQSAPGFSFLSNPVSGVFLPASNELGFSVNSVERMRFTNTDFYNPNTGYGGARIYTGGAGSATNPIYGITGETNTGIYRNTTGTLGFSTLGSDRLLLSANAADFKTNITTAAYSPTRFTMDGDDLGISGMAEFADDVFFEDPVVFNTVPILANNYAWAFGANADSYSRIGVSGTNSQLHWSLGVTYGRQLIFGSEVLTSGYGHAVQPNPTIFIHSVEDPDTDNTEWGSFAHDGDDFVIDQGKGTTYLKGSMSKETTTVGSATHTVGEDDNILHVTYTTAGAVTITIPATQMTDGRILKIKDAGGKAGTNNITIEGGTSEAFDGDTSGVVLSSNYDSVDLYSDGTAWFIN